MNDDIPDFKNCRHCGKDFVYSNIDRVDYNDIVVHCNACGGYFEVPNRDSQKVILSAQRSELLTGCRHCGANFIMSSLLDRCDKTFYLHCSVCDNVYYLNNTKEQEQLLTSRKGHPSQVDPLHDISQLISGDVIAFKRHDIYEHHAVVKKANRKTKKVDVIEFGASCQSIDGTLMKARVVRRELDFDQDIASKNAFLRRYMPLDCRQVLNVIRAAEEFADNPQSMAKYHVFDNNCQHLASFCKTGQRISEDGTKFDKWYIFLIGGTKFVLSRFPHPYVRIANFCVNAVLLGNELYRKFIENDLREKGFQSDGESIIIAGVKVSLCAVAIKEIVL